MPVFGNVLLAGGVLVLALGASRLARGDKPREKVSTFLVRSAVKLAYSWARFWICFALALHSAVDTFANERAKRAVDPWVEAAE